MMHEEEKINPGHTAIRSMLRIVGPSVLLVGVVFTAVGAISFFSSFGSFGEPPQYFWCCFVGIPLIGVGATICQFAFFGAVARYVAGEAAPVGKDTFNYMAHGTRDGIRDVTSAIREGLTGETDHDGQIRCSSCQHPNDTEAKFCEQCGYQLITTRLCSHCDCENDVDAKFCDNCGKPLN